MNVYRVQVLGVLCDMGQCNEYHIVVAENVITACKAIQRHMNKDATEVELIHSDVIIDDNTSSKNNIHKQTPRLFRIFG
jgi:hypothetical protein